MSSYAGRGFWCGKDVMHKTFFGTLHLCLTDEEKFEVVRQRQQQTRGAALFASVAGAGKPCQPSRKDGDALRSDDSN